MTAGRRSPAAAVVLVFLCGQSCTVDYLVTRQGDVDPLGAADGGHVALTCYVLSPAGPVLLVAADMDTGYIRVANRWVSPEGLNTISAMAYDGSMFLVVADDGSGASWYSLWPKSEHLIWLASAAQYEGVGWTGSGWIAPRGDASLSGLARYSSTATLAADEPSALLPDMHYAHFTTDGERLYGIGNSANEVEVRSLSTGAVVHSAPLVQWDGWIAGLSVVGRTLFLLSGASGDRFATIFSLDLDGGALVERARIPGVMPGGLHCTASVL
jgi:hypothetical protein